MQLPVLGVPTTITFKTKAGVELNFRKPTTTMLSEMVSGNKSVEHNAVLRYIGTLLYGYEKESGELYTTDELVAFMSAVEFEDMDEFGELLTALGVTAKKKVQK
jgi:hypothetical protein